MPAGNLLTLLDDIASILDDVAILSKVAARKTTGVLGDDLALNAEQVSGVSADRELPVVWKVAKGSFVNKLILVPSAILISTFTPFLIIPLLFLGGLYLCFEGFEKVIEKFFHNKESNPKPPQTEEEKIKGAIRTDFILSLEIIVIAMGSVAEATFVTRLLVLSLIGVAMTVGVYGLVALIVKLDDLGLWLNGKNNKFLQKLGWLLLALAPRLMKLLSVVGTLAMFLVGGGIISHSFHLLESLSNLGNFFITILEGLLGFISGGVIFFVVHLVSKLKKA
jgi:predicted DNA repair protein MutK